MAKVGRSKRSLSREATRPTTPGVPIGRGEDEDRWPLPAPDLHFGNSDSFFDGFNLDALAFGIEFIEPGGNRERMVLVIDGQQFGAECRVADAAAGVDARTDEENPDDRD